MAAVLTRFEKNFKKKESFLKEEISVYLSMIEA
jgi:hypothetical protein